MYLATFLNLETIWRTGFTTSSYLSPSSSSRNSYSTILSSSFLFYSTHSSSLHQFLLFSNNNGPTTRCSECPMHQKWGALVFSQALITLLAFSLNISFIFWIRKLNENIVSLKHLAMYSSLWLPFNGATPKKKSPFKIVLSKSVELQPWNSALHEMTIYTH